MTQKRLVGAFIAFRLMVASAAAQNLQSPVGIGTTTPAYPLDVNGDLNISGIYRDQGTPVIQVVDYSWFLAGSQASSSSNSGWANIAIGPNALASSDATSHENVAIGPSALQQDTSGGDNVAVGSRALQSNTSGSMNIAIGYNSLNANTAGIQNTAVGQYALQSSTTSSSSTAVGWAALGNFQTGWANSAFGQTALAALQAGDGDNAVGSVALNSIQNDSGDEGLGNFTLGNLTSGDENIAIGDGAGADISNGTQNTTANQNIYIGSSAMSKTNGDTNETVIGAYAVGNGNNSVTLGNTSVASTVLRGNIMLTNGGVNSGASVTFPDSTIQSTAWNGTTLGGDYAESIDVLGDRATYEPGDVIAIDDSESGKFIKSDKPYSKLVAGVYSTKPGLVGRRTTFARVDKDAEVPMAMMGIAPTKVTTENGPIERGDLLVSSSTPGYAMKASDPARTMGAVIGKALAPLKAGSGVIEVLISLQ